jgi:hypothetical protein
MNEAKIQPCRMGSDEVDSSEGVHMNTKMYIEPSKHDCTTPSSRILRSE